MPSQPGLPLTMTAGQGLVSIKKICPVMKFQRHVRGLQSFLNIIVLTGLRYWIFIEAIPSIMAQHSTSFFHPSIFQSPSIHHEHHRLLKLLANEFWYDNKGMIGIRPTIKLQLESDNEELPFQKP